MEKKNFLFVSLTGLISDIAWQVSKEGHEVRYFIGDKKERDIGDGFVAKSKDWEKDVDWADILIFDDTLGQGEKAQALRQQGKKVIGGTPYSDRVGLHLQDFWQLEEHTLGETTFTHYADGSAHKNRMQGNDFVQSVMYRRGVTCFSCHDTHGTENYAQLRKPADKLCLDCQGPLSLNGPRTGTLEEHTHHKKGSAGSSCIACHMPKIATTIAHVKVRSHTFAFITPAMTDKYEIPNPCTTCHAEKSTAWATEELRRGRNARRGAWIDARTQRWF